MHVVDHRRDGERDHQPSRLRDLAVLRLGLGGLALLWGADDAAVRPHPNVIGVGANTNLRLLAQAYGYDGWLNHNIATLSSTGTGQPFSMPSGSGKYVDLVAPGYGGEAARSPLVTSSCPTNTLTEAFGGTSESAPFVAGPAADVIQAYSDTHSGSRPSPRWSSRSSTGRRPTSALLRASREPVWSTSTRP